MKRISKKMIPVVLSLALSLPFAIPASAHSVTTVSASADLRVTLDRLLGEHALLAVVAMQKGISGAPDFNQAADALVNKNGKELSDAIGSVYGQKAGEAFKGLWDTHIGFFVDYVKATAAKDEAGRKAALDKLDQYRFDFGAFLESANPNLKAEVLAQGLQSHVKQLIGAFDKYVAKDYTGAYKDIRDSYAHMFMTGDALAGAIAKQFPEKFSSMGTTNAAVDLRVTVDRLLAEHGFLAALAMQKGIDGAPDFNAAAGALDKNSDELANAIGSIYGKPAGEAFRGLWKSHIGFFVDYVKATAAKDEAGRKAAIDKLTAYGKDFASFLAGANPNLKEAVLIEELGHHVEHLQKAFDQYAAKDYTSSYASLRLAYSHMFMTGDVLSGAIVTQFNEKFHDPEMKMSPKVWMKIGSSELKLDGQTVMMDTAPFMQGSHTYIPLRYLSEGIGAEVTWEEQTQTAWVKAGGNTAAFWIGKDTMEFNGMRKEVGAPVVLKDGRTQVPLRFIAELLGWDVQWDEKDWSITLTKAAAAAPGHMH